jgi:hypothetical protein
MPEIAGRGIARLPLSPILVVGLARSPERGEPWVWRLLDQAEPKLRALAEAAGTFVPEFRKVDPRHFRLSRVAPERERVILVSEAMTGGESGSLRRWHCGAPDGVFMERMGPALPTRPTRLQVVREITPNRRRDPIPVLPYWLDEEIPRGGLEIIRVPGPDARFERALAGLLHLLWDAVREVGKPQERRVAA